ncbi:MAG: enoyl-CoA hydratase/isomerase family protein [Alphaproteobacteria bacterium]|nr:enoyl-CoA hydratase/isomerase family protein [Alphaproteobacteria bacterium]
MTQENEVLFDVQGCLGLITLNKPKALNALSLNMVVSIHNQLIVWASDKTIELIVIKADGNRAFCVGGDVRALYDNRGTNYGSEFCGKEYLLNTYLFNYPKPYLAFMDGAVMGGGVGVSIHGSHRIVTERTIFAMPETGIGLFPDIGAGWFLPRCPGEIGMYLGLTGYRLNAADCIYSGLADYYIPSNSLDTVVDKLSQIDVTRSNINDVLDEISIRGYESTLDQIKKSIDRCFSADSVEDIISRLREEKSDWAEETINIITLKSPTSLKITFKQLRAGASMKIFEDVMAMEYRIATHVYKGCDFFEGIRAVVIDKDGKPNWDPSSLEEVASIDVDEYFKKVNGEPSFR